MKRIETQGITYIEPLDGSRGAWYWGTDYASGDLYEAEEEREREAYQRQGVRGNRRRLYSRCRR